MVSYLLGIGLSAPSAVFKRKSSKKVACIDKETDPSSNRREINKSLSHSTEQSTDDLMDGDENNIHKHIVHLIGSMDSDDMIYKPIHHRLERSHPLLSLSKYVTKAVVTKSVNSSNDGPVATIPLREAVL